MRLHAGTAATAATHNKTNNTFFMNTPLTVFIPPLDSIINGNKIIFCQITVFIPPLDSIINGNKIIFCQIFVFVFISF